MGRFAAGRFDLVVSENELRDMRGDALLVEVQRLDPTVRTILTGDGAYECRNSADLCLSRPLHVEVLLQSIGEVLESKREGRSLGARPNGFQIRARARSCFG